MWLEGLWKEPCDKDLRAAEDLENGPYRQLGGEWGQQSYRLKEVAM